MKSYTIDEAVRDITKVGVCPAPKSKVREIVTKVVESHSTSLVRQLLESVEEREEGEPHTIHDPSEAYDAGWNSCRETMIAKAIQLGVVEKDV